MKKFFIFFAATCIASAAWSDAVYEPLIVSSGFNRDVIAEQIDTTRMSNDKNPDGVTEYAQSYYDYEKSIRYIYPTKKTIRLKHGDAVDVKKAVGSVTVRPIDTAFPDDNGGPEDRRVNCMTTTYDGLYWMLGKYDVPNALCMRKNPSNKGSKEKGILGTTGKLEFQNIGCYQKLYFMVVAGGSEATTRIMHACVHYSDGSSSNERFEFKDHGTDAAKNQAAFHDNILDASTYTWSTASWLTKLNCFAAVCEMNIETHHLIDSITFRLDDETSVAAGIAILAVTGKTADIAAPDANSAPNHAPLRATEITQNTVSVEWDPVDGAESYRIDVATDEDFHNMVAGFNNEAVITSPDTVITGLDADHEYYWRVRAVDSQGGQSASSAPRRVRTESNSGPQTSDEVHTDIKAVLDNYLQTTINLKIARVLYKDGSFNTLCLPFDYSADRIAAHEFLQGCELFTFDSAEQLGESQLDIRMSPATEITAGVPYLVRWANTGAVSDYLTFNGVTITKTVGDTVGDGTVRFIGAIGRQQLGVADDKNYLFVGANNTLYWPNTNNQLRGYRAYFRIFSSVSASAPRYGTPARIVLQPQVATDIEITNTTSLKSAKRIENGQLIIVHGGVRYNVLGQKME